jgi:hypothetical protein
MSQPAMAPPEGVVADLQNPTDVIRTINFVTQALTLAFCSAFVFIRAIQKLRVSTSNLSVDDCKSHILVAWRCNLTDWLPRSHVVVMGVPGRLLHGWSVLYVLATETVSLCVLTTAPVSVYGGGYHLWEVTADSFVQYMKVSTDCIVGITSATANTNDIATGHVRRNNIVRAHDIVHQA